jgi:hypothetical protein
LVHRAGAFCFLPFAVHQGGDFLLPCSVVIGSSGGFFRSSVPFSSVHRGGGVLLSAFLPFAFLPFAVHQGGSFRSPVRFSSVHRGGGFLLSAFCLLQFIRAAASCCRVR